MSSIALAVPPVAGIIFAVAITSKSDILTAILAGLILAGAIIALVI